MQAESTIKTSFFDDEDPKIGFSFHKVDQNNSKDLSFQPILRTKLLKQNSPSGSLHQGVYVLLNKSIGYQKTSSSDVEYILNVNYSLLKPIQLNPLTSHYGFSVTKNGITHEFFSEDEHVIENWINALKHICVLPNFHEEYKAIKMIGKGSFAKVYLVESKTSGKHYAVKAFTKESLIQSNKSNAKPSMVNEIDIMRAVDHENVIKLYEVYETERSLYMVLELIQGKSLQDVLKKSGFKDNNARTINVISSILDALAYLASKGIMHRDLKPDNILLDKGDKVKIVDFGLATFIDLPEYIFKKCGTPGYIAPEVFKYDQKNPVTNYDARCDVFSAGCILYYMLFGSLFFDGPNASEILKLNRKFTVDFQTLHNIQEELNNPNGKISKEALSLLTQLIEFDPKKRMLASQALNHPYLFSVMQQKLEGSFDVYQHGGCSPGIYDRRNSIAQEQHIQQLKNGIAVNSPHRFAEKDSLYLDVGKPEITGKVDTITSGSANNSLLLTRAESAGSNATPNSTSAFAKNTSPGKTFNRNTSVGGNQSFLKAAIFRNMQKNNEKEEVKEDNAAIEQLPEVKSERRHSDYGKSNVRKENKAGLEEENDEEISIKGIEQMKKFQSVQPEFNIADRGI